jgi:hypothetical protein
VGTCDHLLRGGDERLRGELGAGVDEEAVVVVGRRLRRQRLAQHGPARPPPRVRAVARHGHRQPQVVARAHPPRRRGGEREEGAGTWSGGTKRDRRAGAVDASAAAGGVYMLGHDATAPDG